MPSLWENFIMKWIGHYRLCIGAFTGGCGVATLSSGCLVTRDSSHRMLPGYDMDQVRKFKTCLLSYSRLQLQFSRCAWVWVIFVSEVVAVMLAFWSDRDSAVSPFNAPSTHTRQVLTKNCNFMIFIRRKCESCIFLCRPLKYIHLLSALHSGKFLIVWHVKMQSALSFYAYTKAVQKVLGLK